MQAKKKTPTQRRRLAGAVVHKLVYNVLLEFQPLEGCDLSAMSTPQSSLKRYREHLPVTISDRCDKCVAVVKTAVWCVRMIIGDKTAPIVNLVLINSIGCRAEPRVIKMGHEAVKVPAQLPSVISFNRRLF